MRSGIYNITGGVLRAGISLAAIPLLIRLLGREEYGVWILVSAILAAFALLEGGVSMSTTVFAARELRANDSNSLGGTITASLFLILVLAALAALLLVFGAGLFPKFYPKLDSVQRETVVAALRLGAVVISARLVQQLCVALLQATDRFDLLNALATAQAVVTTAGMIAIAANGGKTHGLMEWQATVAVIFVVMHTIVVWFLFRRKDLRMEWAPKKVREIAKASSLTWVSILGGVLFSQCDRLIVGGVAGPALLGVYGAITSAAAQINVLSALPTQPLLRIVNEVPKLAAVGKFHSTIKQYLHVNAFVALTMAAGLITFAPTVVQLLLKSSDAEYIACFRLAIFVYAIYSLNAVGYHVLVGLGALKEFALIQLTSGIFALLLISVGVAAAGLKGALVGNVGYWGVWFLTTRAMRKLSIPAKVWLRILIVYGVWFMVVYAANQFLPNLIVWRIPVFCMLLCVVSVSFLKHMKSFKAGAL